MTPREQALLDAMAVLCGQLAEAWAQGRSLTDPAMVHLSQQLDVLIVEWQRRHPEPPSA